MATHPKRFGLALGGGAARGIAHIGVLKVLDEAGVRPSYICGTSAGSIVGTLYAGGYSLMEILEIVESVDWGDLVQGVFPRKGLLRATRLENRLRELLDDRDLDALDIPCRTVAVDLIAADEYIFRDGPAAIAVRASCSIPGIFEPVETDERVLVDGGVLNDVPVDVALDMGADYALGVNLNADLLPNRRPENVFQILTASFEVITRGCRDRELGKDLKNVMVIAPDLKNFSYQDLKPVDQLVQRGEDAMRAAMPDLLGALKKRKIPKG